MTDIFPQKMHPERLAKLQSDQNEYVDLSRPQKEPVSALLQHIEYLNYMLAQANRDLIKARADWMDVGYLDLGVVFHTVREDC